MTRLKLTDLGQEIFQTRYAYPGETKWQERAKVIAKTVASAEADEDKEKYEKVFYDSIADGDFVPGGRIIYGAGRNAGKHNLLNCYVISPEDSVASIGKTLDDMYTISCAGGGIGFNVSKIRPKGDDISNVKNSAPGAVSFLKMINEVGEHVKSGKARRTALIGILNVTHPDLLEFLQVKLEQGELTNFNISVAITDRFIEAVQLDEDWYFTFNNKEYHNYVLQATTNKGVQRFLSIIALDEEDAIGRAKGFHLEDWTETFEVVKKENIKAKWIWEKIWMNSVNSGDPGVYNIDLSNKHTNTSYFESLDSTNPCITGDTIIATADGRNGVTIATLCEEGKDIPVYSTNTETGKVEIKMGRNPRITGLNKEVYRVTLDDGSYLDATPNHKFLTKDLKYVELKDLEKGQSLFPWNSFDNNGYRQISGVGAKMKGGARRNRRQYRVIAEFNGVDVDPKTHAIHHADYNSLNDSISNLEVMTHEDHRSLHADRMRGKKNPYWTHFTEEQRQDFASHPGDSNPKWISVTNKELIEQGQLIFNRDGKITSSNWRKHAKKEGLPQSLSNDARFGNFSNFRSLVIGNHKVSKIERIESQDVYNITVDDNHNYHVITSNSDEKYVKSSGICIKNCGEIPLPSYGNCCLGNINLSNMVTDDGEVDWPKLAKTVRAGVRFLDNVLTVNHFPIPKCKEVGHNSRRIGLGVFGLHYMLIKLSLRYGSEKCLEFLERLFSTIRDEAYKTSIYLARDKHPFPAFDRDKYMAEGFCKTLPIRIRHYLRKYGIRNAVCLTVPPTGTISMLMGVSSGIEPIFSAMYQRRYRQGNVWKETLVVDPLFKEYHAEGKDLGAFVGAYDITPEDHMRVQATIQHYIDSSLSKTINLPEDFEPSTMIDQALDFMPSMKGMTVYRAGSKGNEPLKAIPLTQENVDKYMGQTTEVATADGQACSIAGGGCGD